MRGLIIKNKNKTEIVIESSNKSFLWWQYAFACSILKTDFWALELKEASEKVV